MNFQFYLEKLQNSPEFKEFVGDNPEAYGCSGFFTLDKEGSDNQRHIDFYLPLEKKIFSFKLQEEGIEKVPMETISEKIPESISFENVDFNFENIEEIILKKMEEQKIKNNLQKIMISLQNFGGKKILVCTVFISMLGILKVHIGLEGEKEGKISLFEKKSFFDIVRKG
jgi:peroxiredoxin family protein